MVKDKKINEIVYYLKNFDSDTLNAVYFAIKKLYFRHNNSEGTKRTKKSRITFKKL